MKPIDYDCKVHVCVCTNAREAPRTGCLDFGGLDFYTRLKHKLRETGLSATHWATRTGCLGFCNPVGTTVVIHIAGKPSLWFKEVTMADFDSIWQEIVRQ